MSSIMTKWSVLQEHLVDPSDLGPQGRITDTAIDRWVALARTAYLQQCSVLEQTRAQRGLELRAATGGYAGGAALSSARAVVVTATATEVLPRSFVISVRVRPVGGASESPLDVRCVIWLEDPARGEPIEIGIDVRDELIAHEHAARHFN